MPVPDKSYGRLKGWRTIVTGAGSMGDGVGTGKAIAVLFAREGARVALVDRDRARAEETSALIAETDGDSIVVTGDVTDPDDCARMAKESLTWLGGIDILVNNVGLGTGAGRLEDMDPADWNKGVDINLNSAFLMSRAVITDLLAGDGKSIVNIASVAGVRAHGSGSYGPAKAAMIHFTRELAVMYGPEGLRANTVVPGHIITPLVEKFSSPDARETRKRIAPLEIEGDAWDIAQAALFLAGPESRFITGVELLVDGGVSQIAALAAHEAMTGTSMTR